MFDSDGKFIHTLFMYPPDDMAFDSEDQLVSVCELKNEVQILQSDGIFITKFHHDKPTCVCVDADGRILIGNVRGNVSVFAFDAYSA